MRLNPLGQVRRERRVLDKALWILREYVSLSLALEVVESVLVEQAPLRVVLALVQDLGSAPRHRAVVLERREREPEHVAVNRNALSLAHVIVLVEVLP